MYDISGVIQTAISDPFMIYAIRSWKPIKEKHKTIDYSCYKKFDEEAFLYDLCNVSRKDIEKFDNVNDDVDLWQQMFSTMVDKHVQKKSKQVKAKLTPWLNRILLAICQQGIICIEKQSKVMKFLTGMPTKHIVVK